MLNSLATIKTLQVQIENTNSDEEISMNDYIDACKCDGKFKTNKYRRMKLFEGTINKIRNVGE